jgi:stage IV sporulation protein B
VIPLGQAVGIKLFSQGVLVVGLQDLTTDQGLASPAKACGVKEGDIITHVNGTPVNSIEEVQAALQQAQGDTLSLRFLRGQETREATTRAVACAAGGDYKLGAWIRDSMAGIGTLTFADPQTGLVATLGHGINDTDTSVLMTLKSGAITPATIASVVKGMDGQPGELRGCFTSQADLADLYANTAQGVFGTLTDPSALSGQAIPVAQPEEVHTGSATILANIVDDVVEEYSVEITRVYDSPTDTRDLMLQVTDPRLLDTTGGIVQGMSGSPILQDGKLVGAVTHVLIDHADQGYGILATHMLEAAQKSQPE